MKNLLVYRLALLAGLLLGCYAPALLAQDDLNADPGYVDFSSFDHRFENNSAFEVNIKGKLLRLVAEASREDDPELAELLLRLRAIQVRSFPMTRAEFRSMETHSMEISDQLRARGWDSVVKVRDYGQYVDVYVKENEDFIEGLMMMVVDNEINETVLINIVGDIQPEELGRIGSKFEIGPLEEMMNQR
jgi:hypothetical protein